MKQPQHASLAILVVFLSAAEALTVSTTKRAKAPPLQTAQLALRRSQLQQPTPLDAWLQEDENEEEEEDEFKESVSGYFRLLESTGTEILQEDLQSQIDLAAGKPDLFIERMDASELEKVAMSSVIEQLPKRAVEALSQSQPKKTENKNKAKSVKTKGVTADQEMQLGRTIRRGAALQRLREKLSVQLGREPTKQEWAAAADLTPNDVRRQISEYRKAKQELVTANLGLVHMIVMRHYSVGEERAMRAELVQEGTLGLFRAAELFDPSIGLRFSSYALVWIRGFLRNSHLKELVKLPQREKHMWYKIVQARKEIARETVAPVSVEQIASVTGLTVAQIADTERRVTQAKEMISLDFQPTRATASGTSTSASVRDEGEDSSHIFAQDKNLQTQCDLLEQAQLRSDLIATMTRALNDREARFVRLRYGLTDGRTRTLDECADAMGLPRGTVHSLGRKCLEKLREAAAAEALEEYFLTIA